MSDDGKRVNADGDVPPILRNAEDEDMALYVVDDEADGTEAQMEN